MSGENLHSVVVGPDGSKRLKTGHTATAPTAPRMKVLCYALPLMGHVTPAMSLAAALAKAKHEVCFATSAALRGKVAESCSRSGFVFHGLEDAVSAEELRNIHPNAGPVFSDFIEKHRDLLGAVAEDFKPTVIVADFASGAGIVLSRERQIPLVANIPMPASLLRLLLMLSKPVLYSVAELFHREDKYAMRYLHHVGIPAFRTTLNIVNSAPALDSDVSLPPNFFVSGPLDGFTPKKLLPDKHADILTFLRRARADEKRVFYITTGSLMDLSKEQVLALYHGFAACRVRVLWSLKDSARAFLPQQLADDFLIRPWMPQGEIMSLSELTAVLTHCGWGGSLECMMAGKPVICFPGFGDQVKNAQLLHQRGCGPLLYPKSVTEGAVAGAVRDVVTNLEKYQAVAQSVSKSLRDSPGPEGAVRVIEQAVRDGFETVVKNPHHLQEESGGGCQVS